MSTRLPYLKLGMNQQLGATDDQRGVLTVELGVTGAADALAVTLRDAVGAYSRQVLFPPLNPPTYAGVILSGGTIKYAGGGTPTIAAGSSAGASPTLVSVTSGNDFDGEATLTPGGAGIAVGLIATITFSAALPDANYGVWIQDRNQAASLAGLYFRARLAGSFEVGAAVAPTSGAAINFSWLLVQR